MDAKIKISKKHINKMKLSKGRKKIITRNKLWIARKRVGLSQKQLASLLNHKTADQISRYERGSRIPTLRIALELEIALRTPLKHLFPELYEQLRKEIRQKVQQHPFFKQIYQDALLTESENHECCTVADLLNKPHPSEIDKVKVRSHVTKLARKIAYL
jgi:transcriptional regulator with XRE-family HTH domain